MKINFRIFERLFFVISFKDSALKPYLVFLSCSKPQHHVRRVSKRVPGGRGVTLLQVQQRLNRGGRPKAFSESEKE